MSWVKRAGDYVKEVRAESAKVSWPGRKEVQAATVVVLIMVGILSVFIWGIDRIYLFFLGLLFGRSAT
jgi:preprotein translocase subunit SecE